MQPSPPSRGAAAPPAWRSPVAFAGLAVVAAARLLTLPQGLWEQDEVLFVAGVERFDPLAHRPHPPGYPLLVGLGKLFAWLLGDAFEGLVALSVMASLVGYLALVDAFARLAPRFDARLAAGAGVAGALLFHLAPPMLVYGPLALSDGPALGFLALSLAALSRLPGRTAEDAPGAVPPGGGVAWWGAASLAAPLALGAAAAGAVGCRPQLSLAVLPMLAAAALLARSRRVALAIFGAFAVTCMTWFVPLLSAAGGPAELLAMMRKQAATVATYDAAVERAGMSFAHVATRFVAHPWGAKWTSLPLLALAAVGTVVLLRRGGGWRGGGWRVLPLFVLCGVELLFGLRALHPADATRYALPSLLAVAFLAGCGTRALAGRWAPAAAAALGAGFVAYTWPLLVVRSTQPSPPAAAAAWVREAAPADAFVLYQAPLAAHAWHLLDRPHASAEAGPPVEHRGPVLLFADGLTGVDGEVSFAWPASDAWGKLTRRHYRVVAVAPVPATRLCVPRRGVYAMEPTPQAVLLGTGEAPAWRWLAQEAELSIAPRGAEVLVLRLGLPAASPLAEVGVEVQVAGAEPRSLRVRREHTQELMLPLPPRARVEIAVRSDGSFVPAEVGVGADRRRLAVQLLGCELRSGEPAVAPASAVPAVERVAAGG